MLAAGLVALPLNSLFAIEEAEFSVISESGDFEIREYAPSIVAETLVDDDFEGAGNRAFRKLFNYISGDNSQQDKIAMTSPVGQRPSGDGWAVAFMMPATYTMDTIPTPDDPTVVIRAIPAYRAAVVTYSGTWSEKNYRKQMARLEQWVNENELEAIGEPVWARYDPPFKPWFMRRNEILIPLN
jgi:hypothetical protein